MERLGLLFADGSLLVFAEKTALETAKEEARESDFGESEPRTRVVRVTIDVVDLIE